MVEENYPASTARLSITLFSAEVNVAQNMILQSAEEHANVIRTLTQPTGVTNMKAAFQTVWYNVFEGSVREDENRDRLVLLFTDGQPSLDQDPQEVYEKFYEPNDIQVLSICMSELCETEQGKQYLEAISDVYEPVYLGSLDGADGEFTTITTTFLQDCNFGERDTPYNGWYSRITTMTNGRPTYRDEKKGFEAYWDTEAWTFRDYRDGEVVLSPPMAETQGTEGSYPYSLRNWTIWYSNQLSTEIFTRVIICCKNSPTPTCQPTLSPTVMPSRMPTTEQPTRIPSQTPTTEEPSFSPSVVPTCSPSSDTPTVAPTKVPSVAPSMSPTADQPTRGPSGQPTPSPTSAPTTSPTTLPTVPPSNNPTKNPTSDMPTIQPTNLPTPVEPTKWPSTSPTTSQPTKHPHTSMPTTSPTPSPTDSPHTTTPTRTPSNPPSHQPSVDPSKSPSTTPSVTPSMAPSVMPTRAPSTSPTQSPTDDCEHFHFCYCCTIDCGDSIDVLLILDSSSSIETSALITIVDQLSLSVQRYFPNDDDSKIGAIMFATRVDTDNKIPILNRPRSDTAELITNMALTPEGNRRLSGSTYMQEAMKRGMDMWEDDVSGTVLDPERNQWTIILTDGKPTGNQDPCLELPDYLDHGIQVALVGIGDAADGDDVDSEVFQCFREEGQTIGFNNIQEALAPTRGAVDSIFRFINVCPAYIKRTPYDGYWSRTDDRINGKPVYVHKENFILSWQIQEIISSGFGDSHVHEEIGFWEFYDPTRVQGKMLSYTEQTQIYPDTMSNWTYFNYTRQSVISSTWRGFEDTIYNYTCPVECKKTPIPTRFPSVTPTKTPSRSPSVNPTKDPTTDQPSVMPTDIPTVAPTTPPTTDMPTVNPTSNPTTEEPTGHPHSSSPSGHPTSDQPTKSPSTALPTPPPTHCPTTDQPSVSPTLSPTTEEPSFHPTTDQPSHSPSVSPTTTDPTTLPTPSPTTAPSVSPTSAQPTVGPTAQPSDPPSLSPTICVCDFTCPEKLERAVDFCQDYRNSYERITECDACGTVINSCDECWRNDIEEVRAGLNVVAGDVQTYEQCEDLKTQAINHIGSVSADIDALVLTLTQDDIAKWQAVFTEYNMPCSRIPLRYCPNMLTGADEACAACNDECVQIDADCEIDP